MNRLFGKVLGILSKRVAREGPFFLFFYLYVYFVVDARLIYHGAGRLGRLPVFYTGWEYLREFLSRPGGIIEYVSAFVFQFFYYRWSGASVVILEGLACCVIINEVVRKINGRYFELIRFVPSFVLLALSTKYTNFIVLTTAFTATIVFVLVYIKFRDAKRPIPFLVFLITAAIAYPVIGGLFWLFVVLCAIYEMFYKYWLRRISLLVLGGLAVVGVYQAAVYEISNADVLSNLLPFSWNAPYNNEGDEMIINYVLLLFLPAGMAVLKILQLIFPQIRTVKAGSDLTQSSTVTEVKGWKAGVAEWIICNLIFLAAMAGVYAGFFSDKRKAEFAVDYYAYHKDWAKVLEVARKDCDNFFIAHHVNQALYQTGQLGEKMFSYPQHISVPFLNEERFVPCTWQKFDVYLDLGFINIAENHLIDCMESFGELPAIMQRLAAINMAKGNIEAARIYLNRLNRTLFGAGWSRKYLSLLDSDSNLSQDPNIKHMREQALKKDVSFNAFDHEKNLLSQVENKNRMAFEYLMSYYLLANNLEAVVGKINLLGEMGYKKIPRHYEEAILIYTAGLNKQYELKNYQISSETRKRFEEFNRILNVEHQGDREAAFDELVKYRDSYFFYYLYGYSGLKE